MNEIQEVVEVLQKIEASNNIQDELKAQLREKIFKSLKPYEIGIVMWQLQRRPEQQMPASRPLLWFLLGGRGSGKTKTGANHIYETACTLPWIPKNRQVRIALVGNVYDDVKKTMIEGDSGLLGVIPPETILKWNRTIGELTVRIDGPDEQYRELIFSSYTATSPQKLRGPQFHLAWIDEPAKFEDADMTPTERDTTWSNLILGLRLGDSPHMVITGTPTPCKLVQYLLAHEDCVTTVMTTWANRANLPEAFRRELERLDPNSRTYRQEVLAEVLLDNPESLFSEETIDLHRAEMHLLEDGQMEIRSVNRSTHIADGREFHKVLGYDPSMSSSPDADEAGIILTGYMPEKKMRAMYNANNTQGGGRPVILEPSEAFILKDLSDHLAPSEQAELVIKTVLNEKVSDLVVEINQGADFVVTLLSQALKDQTAEYQIRRHKKARTTDWGSVKRFTVKATLLNGEYHQFVISAIQATRSKKVRAETAAYQYDFGRVHHPFKDDGQGLPICDKEQCRTSLEYEQTSWNPNKSSHRYMSPNRLDALVYTLLFIFGRHVTHTQSKLIAPGHTRALTEQQPGQTPMTYEQKNPGKPRIGPTSIYSRDMLGGGRRGF